MCEAALAGGFQAEGVPLGHEAELFMTIHYSSVKACTSADHPASALNIKLVLGR